MKLTARPILRRFGFRMVIIINSVISAATIIMCAFFTGATPIPVIFALLLIAGFFQSLQFTATQAMTYADVEQPQMSSATSIASMSQQLSRGFGISFVAALLNLTLAWRGGEHLGLPDFTVAFAGAALLALLNLPFGWVLRHDAAAEVSGHRPAGVITPWVGVLTHLKGIKSAPQHAIAVERACWQGEAVCAIVAKSRAEAEDACALVGVDYEVLAAVTDAETALDAATPVIHPGLGDNLTFERVLNAGDPDKGFAEADAIVETTFVFGRHTGVTNEARAIVADWNPGEQRLTVYQGTQAPHMMQNLFAKHLGLEEHQVRVLTKDVGGSFGIKVHTYADEMAVVALAKLLKRPVKFVADRFESFVTDIHARDHRVKARIGVKKDGAITAFEIDDLTGIGPYSVYPRTSGIEANQVVNLVGRALHLPEL